nr:SDR family NAD(P)-dependent oxidoreductase [Mesorhizobium delmotii]
MNSAGIIRRGSTLETTDDDWRLTFDANVNGVFYFSRAAVKAMRTTGGGIVNIASNGQTCDFFRLSHAALGY